LEKTSEDFEERCVTHHQPQTPKDHNGYNNVFFAIPQLTNKYFIHCFSSTTK
jgi:hypothetical protein